MMVNREAIKKVCNIVVGVISPVLSNWALDGLQDRLKQSFSQRYYTNKKRTRPKVHLVRYADDFIITGNSKEYLETEVKPVVTAFLSERGLALSPDKTRITHITEGFDFLGQNIRQYKNTVLTKPAKKNVKAFLEKVRTTLNRNKAVAQLVLIAQLNPIIVGWANYHRHAAAKETFNKVDHEIWRALWRWCCRRHPDKGRRWIKRRYFHQEGNQNWVFMAHTGMQLKDGKPKWLRLRKTFVTVVRRYPKIKAEANPFDPAWESYFEERTGQKMLNHLDGRKRLIRLWRDQQGLCPMCKQRITEDSGWHVHHIVRRVDGGNNTTDNLLVLHPYCHRQLHSLGLTVTKPTPNRGFERLEPCALKEARTVLRGGSDGKSLPYPTWQQPSREAENSSPMTSGSIACTDCSSSPCQSTPGIVGQSRLLLHLL